MLILTTQYLPKIGGSELAIANLTRRLPDVTFDIVTAGVGGKWLFPFAGFVKGCQKKYDIIHAWQASYAGGAGWLLKIFFPNIPFIVTLQEGKKLNTQSFLVRFLRRVILQKADVIIAISSYLLAFAKETNPHASHILLPNGVDAKMFSVLPVRDPRLIVTSSRLVSKNGIDTLIRAMPLIPDCRLEIIGDGPLRDELERLVRELGIVDRVTFVGEIAYELLPQRLAHASVFVRPSRSEGLGIAFLDAMAAGVPIVGTPVGGIPDFLKERVTGMFCRPNDPQSVATAVQELMHDKALRDRVASNALRLVKESYDWEKLAQQYHEIISHYSRI